MQAPLLYQVMNCLWLAGQVKCKVVLLVGLGEGVAPQGAMAV